MRSSRKPRLRRLSRIAFIRSARYAVEGNERANGLFVIWFESVTQTQIAATDLEAQPL